MGCNGPFDDRLDREVAYSLANSFRQTNSRENIRQPFGGGSRLDLGPNIISLSRIRISGQSVPLGVCKPQYGVKHDRTTEIMPKEHLSVTQSIFRTTGSGVRSGRLRRRHGRRRVAPLASASLICSDGVGGGSVNKECYG